MNMLLESLRSALASIRAHGLRSFLTTLGIIIGVASVIAVVSLIQGQQLNPAFRYFIQRGDAGKA